jgi:hypothetical protein
VKASDAKFSLNTLTRTHPVVAVARRRSQLQQRSLSMRVERAVAGGRGEVCEPATEREVIKWAKAGSSSTHSPDGEGLPE